MWDDPDLAEASATEAQGKRRWGVIQWKFLKRRLAELLAAPTLLHMTGLPGHCHALRGDRHGQFAIGLDGRNRLIFEPDYDPVPLLMDGGIDRAAVTRIRILEVVDYHDE